MEISRNIGKFTVDAKLLYDADETLLYALFDKLIVVRCELRYEDNALHYTAIGRVFDSVRLGAEIPKYDVTIIAEINDFYTVVFKRKDKNG